MRLKHLLTKDELREVKKQNVALLKEAHRRGVFPTDEQKRELWQILLNKKIATKRMELTP